MYIIIPDSRRPKPDCIVKIMNVLIMMKTASVPSCPATPPNGLSAIGATVVLFIFYDFVRN